MELGVDTMDVKRAKENEIIFSSVGVTQLHSSSEGDPIHVHLHELSDILILHEEDLSI